MAAREQDRGVNGDGWVRCAQGHRHWGRFGAAGLLVVAGGRLLLAHRAFWSHHGGTWGIPGGARDGAESARDAALREAVEETGLDAAGAKDRLADMEARRSDAINRRDSYSGVNIDEELASLVTLQNSYSAAARVMSTATQMYDTLIGLVGR